MSEQPSHAVRAAEEVAAQHKTWGIYVYFAADVRDSQMEAAVWKTLGAIATVGSDERVKITAMIDLPGRDTEYYIIPRKSTKPGGTPWPLIPDRFLSNVNSASIDTILDFFSWSKRNCPAENIALIFYGHGYAIDDFDPRITAGNAKRVSTFSKGRTADTFPGEHGSELRLLYDSTHQSVLNNRDFAQAIRDYTVDFNEGRRVQVLGLDCCNMAMAEVLSELQGSVEYAVAAETGLPFQSWLSAPILRKFLASPLIDARHFAVDAVQDFIGAMSRANQFYVELSACNLVRFRALEDAMRQLVNALLPAIDKFENREAVSRAWLRDVNYAPDGLIDLASFCRFLGEYVDSHSGSLERAVIAAAEVVRTAVRGSGTSYGAASSGGVVDLARVAPAVTDRRIALSTGLSIWFPPWIQFPNVRYFQMKQSQHYLFHGYSCTHFAKVTGWDCFLQKLFYLTQR